MWGSGPEDLIAVGDSGTAARFDGRRWYPLETGTTRNLRAVWGTGPTDVYAVGEDGVALRWDGARWASINLPTEEWLLGIWGAGGVVYSVGTTRNVISGRTGN